MIEIKGLAVRCGSFQLEGLDLHLVAGERAVLTGPSGADKTTLLEAICGLRPIAAGTIGIDGHDARHAPPGRRSIGYVPQDGVLFTTMPVFENLAYGLRMRGVARGSIEERVEEVAALLGVTPLLDRYPRSLSGGEARRVALGRAISFRPRVLLLDEPLTGLDSGMRDEVQAALQAAYAATGATVLHVSHDPRDAMKSDQRGLHLEGGRLIEVTYPSPTSQGPRDLAGELPLNPRSPARST